MMHRILVVEDMPDLARGIAMILAPLSSRVRVVHSAEEALEELHQEGATLVLSDIRMSGMDGLGLLQRIHEDWPQTRVILFTAYATIDSAVTAMKRGAYDYLTKPFDKEELLLIVRRALKEVEDQDELLRLKAELRAKTCFHGIHSRDPRMFSVIESIRRVAPGPSTVLIWGESGTGKELVARAIHAESSRASRPFVAFNGAALSEGLIEAELFGCVKGAYTGADRDRKGLFLEADGGTLFIDEVSSMSLGLQAKLLRVLQEREILPVGSPVSVKVFPGHRWQYERYEHEGHPCILSSFSG
jgi:two-component system NtrC family response regulator